MVTALMEKSHFSSRYRRSNQGGSKEGNSQGVMVTPCPLLLPKPQVSSQPANLPFHLLVWDEGNQGRSILFQILHWIKVRISEVCPRKGVRRGDSRLWGTLQILTRQSGNGKSLPLKLLNKVCEPHGSIEQWQTME